MPDPPVHCLVTCRNPDLLAASTLVFRPLRTGFPTAPVLAWCNRRQPDTGLLPVICTQEIERSIRTVTDSVYFIESEHDVWLERLIQTEAHPFWVVDTAVVFFDDLEVHPLQGAMLAGEWIPAWHEEWSRTFHVERLKHPKEKEN